MKSRRGLFIGNSFTNRNDLPGTIAQLAAAAHPPCQLETRRIIANGRALKTHWERGEAREAIRGESWDYVVLQEQSTLPLKNRQRMHEFVTMFDTEIKARGARTVLYLTWARQNAWERQNELTDAYASIGRKLGAIVVPVGVAWQRFLNGQPGVELHDKDKSHPNPAGSYLAACVFFATLLQQSPVGLPVPKTVESKLGPEAITSLQEAAWKTATDFRIPS